jgi:hypothetical protein
VIRILALLAIIVVEPIIIPPVIVIPPPIIPWRTPVPMHSQESDYGTPEPMPKPTASASPHPARISHTRPSAHLQIRVYRASAKAYRQG